MGLFSFVGDIFEEVFSWFGMDTEVSGQERGTELNISDNTAPIPIIYGTRKVGGVRAYVESGDQTGKSDKRFLYMALVLCEGEIDSIGGVFIDDKPASEFGTTRIETVGSFTGYDDSHDVVIRKYLGTDSQTSDALLQSCSTGKWTASHHLKGLAYLAIRLRYDPEQFSGWPEITALVRGKKVYNADTTVTEYSTNPAWCLRDYMTNARYGKGLASGFIDDTSFIAAATDCEATESVMAQVNLGQPDNVVIAGDVVYIVYNTKPADAFVLHGAILQNAATSPSKVAVMRDGFFHFIWAGQETGVYFAAFEMTTGTAFTTADTIYADASTHTVFECNAVVDTGETMFDNVKRMLQGMRGNMPYVQGKYALYIEKDRTTVFDFNHSHIIGGISIQAPSKKDKYNRVTVTYTNPNANWKEDIAIFPDAGSATETTLLGEDNNAPLHHEVSLDTVTNYYQARELARLILYKSRNNIRCSFMTTSEALECSVGDIVTVTHTTPGWSAKKFLITSMGLTETGEVKLEMVEHSAAIYNYDSVPAALLKDDTDLGDPFTVATPTSLNTTTLALSKNGGGWDVGIDVDWACDDTFVARYEVQYKASADSVYKSVFSGDFTALVFPLVWGLTYNVRVRAISTTGVSGPWATAAPHVVDLDTTAPGVPTGLSVNQLVGTLSLTWTNPTDFDFSYVEIYVNTSDSIPGTATQESFGTQAVVDGLTSGTTYFVWLKAVDNVGNVSAATASVSSAAGLVGAGDLDSDALNAQLILGTSSAIYSPGKDAFLNTTAGIWIGYDNTTGINAYKFNIGDDVDYIKWHGNELEMSAVIITTGGDSSKSTVGVGVDVFKSGSYSGKWSTALGFEAARDITSGGGVTLVGYQAGAEITTGSGQTYVGQNAGFGSETGAHDTAIGFAAGTYLMTGTVSGGYNTIVGSQAGSTLSPTSSYNTYIGKGAGGGIDGDGNVYIGYDVAYGHALFFAASDELAIHNTNSATPIIGGDMTAGAPTLTLNADVTISDIAAGSSGALQVDGTLDVDGDTTFNNDVSIVGIVGGGAESNLNLIYGTILHHGKMFDQYDAKIDAGFYIVGDSLSGIIGGGTTGSIKFSTNGSGTVTAQSVNVAGTGYERDFYLNWLDTNGEEAIFHCDVSTAGAITTVTLIAQSAALTINLTDQVQATTTNTWSSWNYRLWNDYALSGIIDAKPGRSVAKAGTAVTYMAPPATSAINIALIHLGTNDTGQIDIGTGFNASGGAPTTTEAAWKAAYNALIDAFQADGYRVILILNPYNDVGVDWDTATGIIQGWIRDCAVTQGITEVWDLPTTDRVDGVHPSNTGHRLMRTDIYPRLVAASDSNKWKEGTIQFDRLLFTQQDAGPNDCTLVQTDFVGVNLLAFNFEENDQAYIFNCSATHSVSVSLGIVAATGTPTLASHLTRKDYVDALVGDAASITTGILAVARGGTGVATSTGTGSTVRSIAPTLTGTTTVDRMIFAQQDAGPNDCTLVQTDFVGVNLLSFNFEQNDQAYGFNCSATHSVSISLGIVAATGTPTAVSHLTRKDYVDAKTWSAANITSGTLAVARGGTGVTTSTGTGNTVLSASPTFTGTVTAATVNASGYYGTGAATELHWNSTDYFYINAASAGIYFDSLLDFQFTDGGRFDANGDVYAFSTAIASDPKLKDFTGIVQCPLETMRSLHGWNYNWKKNGLPSIGLRTDEVEPVLPALISVQDNLAGESYKALNYNGLWGVQVEWNRAVDERIAALEVLVEKQAALIDKLMESK